jgi:MerR family transcriptional regulator, light-induced transcriptional regulator
MLYDLGPTARRVYQLLLDRIRSGELAPGERLPSHTRLAEAFGVAPLTVRQVLARLEADNLLSREWGRGTFVRGPEGPRVLVVIGDPALRAAVVDQVERAGWRTMLAVTPAEGLAALDRESSLVLAIVDLRLSAPTDGLRFVRDLRRRKPALAVAVLDPTGRQTTRLEHSVGPPPVIVRHPIVDQLAQMLRAEVGGALAPSFRDAAPAQPSVDLLESYMALQLRGERASARALLLDAVADGQTMLNVYQRVLAPAQYRLGELWQRNQISVAREHLATAITASVMAELAATAPRAGSAGNRVLVTCVEGEFHDLGARMVADLLELDGFVVRFLGASLPTDSLLAMVEEERPHLLVLSVTMLERWSAVRDVVARVRATHGSAVRIVVGGQLVRWLPDASMDSVEVDLIARDALETLEFARRQEKTR